MNANAIRTAATISKAEQIASRVYASYPFPTDDDISPAVMADFGARCILAATPPASDAAVPAGEVMRFYALPLTFHEPADDNGAAYVRDANGQTVAMLMWPGHSMADTDAAVAETYALGRAFAAAAPKVASDTGVPAAEVERACEQSWDATHTVLWRHASEQRRAEWAVGIRAALAAAAPKVASDTGAGLRKALQPFLHAAEPIIHDDRERWQTNEWTRRMLRITVGEFRALYAAALATPTDATGGATGGGEDLAQRLTKPAQGNTIAMLAYAAELGTQPGIARWLRSVDNVGEFDSIRLSIAITALALATTPGGDLLEQAARYREALRQIAETQRERFAFAASHVEWCQRIARDTLKPAGDGGEA